MSKKRIMEIVLGLVLVGLLGVGIASLIFYRSSLGPELKLNPTAETADADAKPAVQAAAEVNKEVALEATSTSAPEQEEATVTPAPAGMCGQSEAMVILLLGRDDKHWLEPWGADSIRLLKVDFTAGTLTVFSVPRDLMLETAALDEPYGISAERIGPVYEAVLGKVGSDQAGNVEATRAIAQVLADNFGISADHYLTVTESVFPTLVDIFGGVEVDVPEAINSPEIQIAAGVQTLNGELADRYIRYIGDRGDFARFERQNAVLVGLMREAAEPDTLTKVPQLYEQFNKNIFTDLSPEQIVALACMANQMDRGKVGNFTFSPDEVTLAADNSLRIVDLAASRQYIQDLFE